MTVPGGLVLTPVYNPTNLTLTVNQVPPSPGPVAPPSPWAGGQLHGDGQRCADSDAEREQQRYAACRRDVHSGHRRAQRHSGGGDGWDLHPELRCHQRRGYSATQSFTLTVNQAPAFTSASSTTFAVGQAGSFTVTASGVPTPTLSESSSDTLPARDVDCGHRRARRHSGGGDGGTYTLNFTATNGVGSAATQSFTLTVNQGPSHSPRP